VVLPVASRDAIARLGDRADATPLAIDHLEHLVERRSGRGVALWWAAARVSVLDARFAALELVHDREYAAQQIDRLAAGDRDRHAVARGDRVVGREPRDRAHVARAEEALYAVVGGLQDARDRWRDEHVRGQHREVAQPLAVRGEDRHRIRGCGGLEADAEE